jgi:ATP-dependent exoDNAse (exonuclease V) beta subunit
MSTSIRDQGERIQALNIEHSFIVQAPAGSGKTELLIQRYLRLLSVVSEPEEIIAITFTNKATSEMRGRILEALESANGTEPEQEHMRLTWKLSSEVLRRNQELGWNLQQSPKRIRIQTIDSLCSSISHQLPLLSTLGGKVCPAEKPQEMYELAARSAIRHLEHGKEWGDAVAVLLGHLGNNIPRLEELLVTMLSKRDQWLRHVVSDSEEWLYRQGLELALEEIVEEALTRLVETVPTSLVPEIIRHGRYAAENIKADSKNKDVLACLDIQTMPSATCMDILQWKGLADLLLTQKDTLRGKVDKREGYPADSAKGKPFCKQMKESFLVLMEELQAYPDFITMLTLTRSLPPIQYSEDQWRVMQALFVFLKISVAELKIVMAERGQVDFIEMALSANTALGEDDAPTDLAMALDYRIQHILVDEFQDTSYGQYELLRKLTRGWEPDDGRTLFLVGDPMQSIYRFREAEVGLYLRARQAGIGQTPLIPLTLSVNFRSQQGIVDWVNRVFQQVLPPHEDIGNGAVTYADSTPFHNQDTKHAVQIHPILGRNDRAEAIEVQQLVQEAQREKPNDSIAILVRSRNHLTEIIQQLKESGIKFQAVDVEPLAQRPVIYDLMALTRAIQHSADRLAWLAILRAPWCGLSLEDLHALAATDHNLTIWELINSPGSRGELSSDGQGRLQRVNDILKKTLDRRRRVPLRDLIEGTWLALGGAAVVQSETELEEARMLFELLEQFDQGGEIADFTALDSALNDLYTPPDVESGDRLQLMTIHAAKGLEFDRVIIPGLGKRTGIDESKLLYWLERSASAGESDLLLAPIKGADEQGDPIYRYLNSLSKEKDRLEEGRLLYVAATRARKQLHLLGHVEYGKDTIKDPDKRSLLSSFWLSSEIRDEFNQLSGESLKDNSNEQSPVELTHPVRRLPLEWKFPETDLVSPLPEITTKGIQETNQRESVEFEWASETARHIGTLVHRYLQRIAKEGLDSWNRQRINSLHQSFGNTLVHLGVPMSDLDSAVSRVDAALSQALADAKGRWILSAQHHDARSEYALSSFYQGKLVNIVIDRTFVDSEGTRWIIDYKSGVHSGPDLDEFIDREQERYCGQMERYAEIFKQLDDRPIKLGLYFPLMSGWRSWDVF